MAINVIKETVEDTYNKYMAVDISPEKDHLLILIHIIASRGYDVLHARLHASLNTTKHDLYDYLDNRYGDVEAYSVCGTKYLASGRI